MPEIILSYDTLGNKESFSDWVSNISPYDTPFVSFTGKAKTTNTHFQWQTDQLDTINTENAFGEDQLPDMRFTPTTIHDNYTQILRKVVKVSFTSDALDTHGRGKELEYQMEKASKEIKRDLEFSLLSSQTQDDGSTNGTRRTGGFLSLVAGKDEEDPLTGAVVHKAVKKDELTLDTIFDITKNLYLSGSRANTIMVHPTLMKVFSSFKEKLGKLVFSDEDTGYTSEVYTLVDPLGQKYNLLPNDHISPFLIYIFHPHDWFQRVLREPTYSELGTDGSSTTYMLEMEVGLQHRNPFASGVIELTYDISDASLEITSEPTFPLDGGSFQATYSVYNTNGVTPIISKWSSSDTSIATVTSSGKVIPVSIGEYELFLEVTFPLGEKISTSKKMEITIPNYNIELNEIGLVWKESQSIQLTYSTSHPRDLVSVTWESSDPEKVSISDMGVLTPLSEGEFTITLTGFFPYSVVKKSVKSSSVIPTTMIPDTDFSLSITAGETVNITDRTTLQPDAAAAIGFTLTSNNPKVSVKDNGDVFGLAATNEGEVVEVTIASKATPSVKRVANITVNSAFNTVDITRSNYIEGSDLYIFTIYHSEEVLFTIKCNEPPSFTPKVELIPYESEENSTRASEVVVDPNDPSKFTFKLYGLTPSDTSFNRDSIKISTTFPFSGVNVQTFEAHLADYMSTAYISGDTPSPLYVSQKGSFIIDTIPKNTTTYSLEVLTPDLVEVTNSSWPTTDFVALKEGDVQINYSVTFPDNTTLTNLLVFHVYDASVSWGNEPPNGGTGDTYTASVITTPSDNASILWSSSDETVAKVASDGTITYLKIGNTTIKASVDFGNSIVREISKEIEVSGVPFTIEYQRGVATDLWIEGETYTAQLSPSRPLAQGYSGVYWYEVVLGDGSLRKIGADVSFSDMENILLYVPVILAQYHGFKHRINFVVTDVDGITKSPQIYIEVPLYKDGYLNLTASDVNLYSLPVGGRASGIGPSYSMTGSFIGLRSSSTGSGGTVVEKPKGITFFIEEVSDTASDFDKFSTFASIESHPYTGDDSDSLIDIYCEMSRGYTNGSTESTQYKLSVLGHPKIKSDTNNSRFLSACLTVPSATTIPAYSYQRGSSVNIPYTRRTTSSATPWWETSTFAKQDYYTYSPGELLITPGTDPAGKTTASCTFPANIIDPNTGQEIPMEEYPKRVGVVSEFTFANSQSIWKHVYVFEITPTTK